MVDLILKKLLFLIINLMKFLFFLIKIQIKLFSIQVIYQKRKELLKYNKKYYNY